MKKIANLIGIGAVIVGMGIGVAGASNAEAAGINRPTPVVEQVTPEHRNGTFHVHTYYYFNDPTPSCPYGWWTQQVWSPSSNYPTSTYSGSPAAPFAIFVS